MDWISIAIHLKFNKVPYQTPSQKFQTKKLQLKSNRKNCETHFVFIKRFKLAKNCRN